MLSLFTIHHGLAVRLEVTSLFLLFQLQQQLTSAHAYKDRDSGQ